MTARPSAGPPRFGDRAPGTRRVGFWDRLLRVAAVGYPIALLLVVLAFRFIGDRWWIVGVSLYLPRLGFALPLPFLAIALALRGPRTLLYAQSVSIVLLLFPLMGLHLSSAAAPTPGATRLRILTLNVSTGAFGNAVILAYLNAAAADVVLLQEVHPNQREILAKGLSTYPAVHVDGQFLLASRFPLLAVIEPPRISHLGKQRSPRYRSYLLETPGGPIRVFNVHLISPRETIEELRGEGLRSEVKSGRLFAGGGAAKVKMEKDSALRLAQVRAIAEEAGRSPQPVIIAGDTNLPGLSWSLGPWLDRHRDGFAEVGTGFGYTFPATRHPWMRIDRVLAGPQLRFLEVEVACGRVSDHCPVAADLELLTR